jgi:alkylation response protein AidB-like acyl-CoA dehydrogenase
MNLDFTEEQKMLRSQVHDFMDKDFPKTLVREMEDDPTGFRVDIWKKMVNLGWTGLIIPEEYGGIGGSLMDLVVLLEETGQGCLVGPLFSTITGTLLILIAGSEDQKKEFLPKIAGGETIVVPALTEPGAIYEASGIETSAVPAEPDEYIINGTKLFIQDAQVANYFICAARTTKWASPEESITLFLVDAESPGIKITPFDTIAADKQCEVNFENVRVPKVNMLGGLNQGWPIVARWLEQAAIAKCAEISGATSWMVENCSSYVKDRIQYSQPIGSFGVIQSYLAQMYTETGLARRYTYYVAWLIEQGMPCSRDVAMCKAWASDVYCKWSRMGVQIYGGYGTSREYDMQLYYRRARQAQFLFGDPNSLREKVASMIGL